MSRRLREVIEKKDKIRKNRRGTRKPSRSFEVRRSKSSASSKSSSQSGDGKGGSSKSLSSVGTYESGSSYERRYMSTLHRKNRGKNQ